MPTPLPFDAADGLGPDASSTYHICCDFEQHAISQDDAYDAMNARILGYLIIYSPSITARNEVIKAIHSCNNDIISLSALGSMFLDYYILPCE